VQLARDSSLKKRKGKRFRDAEGDLVVRRRASCISLKAKRFGAACISVKQREIWWWWGLVLSGLLPWAEVTRA